MFFRILVKNSIRLDKNSIAFKVLSYLVQKGFDKFILILKDEKSTFLKKYISLLLGILKRKEILQKFNLAKQEVENCLNLTEFVNVIQSESMKSYNNKLFFFVLLFFSEFVTENDQIISEEIKKYLKEKEIKNFYEMLEKEKLKNKKEECNENKKSEDKTEKCNDELENKKNINEIIIEDKGKNEIADDFSNHLIQNTDDSSTVEKKSQDQIQNPIILLQVKIENTFQKKKSFI